MDAWSVNFCILSDVYPCFSIVEWSSWSRGWTGFALGFFKEDALLDSAQITERLRLETNSTAPCYLIAKYAHNVLAAQSEEKGMLLHLTSDQCGLLCSTRSVVLFMCALV